MAEKRKTLKEEEEAKRSFLLQVGNCVSEWSMVEMELERIFQQVTRMTYLMAQKVFYSANGFDARTRMLLAAMEDANIDPGTKVLIEKLINLARNYARTRNQIVHGKIVYNCIPESKHHGQLIIIQGRVTPKIHHPDSEVLTEKNLQVTAENFGHLVNWLMVPFTGKGENPAESALKHLQLIEKLAVPAHTGKLGPSVAGLPTRLPA